MKLQWVGQSIAKELLETGTYNKFTEGAISYAELNPLWTQPK